VLTKAEQVLDSDACRPSKARKEQAKAAADEIGEAAARKKSSPTLKQFSTPQARGPHQ
jgi:hypothetical protein